MAKFNTFYRNQVKFQRLAFKGKSQSKWFLISLIILLLIPLPMQLFPNNKQLVFEIILTFVVFFGVQLVSDTLKHFTIGLLLGGLSIALIWFDFFNNSVYLLLVLKPLIIIAFLSYLGFHLFKFVASQKIVDGNMILVSISGYLLIGIFGGQLFYAINLVIPNSFILEADKPLFAFTYYAFTILTSLDFGVISANTQMAQSLSLIIAIAGELYITILVAILVGKYLMHKQY